MKSLVFQEITEKKYFLAYYDCFWRYTELTVNSLSDHDGYVESKESHIRWEVLFETDGFIRELTINDLIYFDGKDYRIETVSHSNDGSILYFINKKEVKEHEDSKLKAEEDLAARKNFLEIRFAESERIEKEKIKKTIAQLNLKPKKKWYQF